MGREKSFILSSLPTNNVRGDHHKIIKKIGEESVTLLKNEGGLPLKAKENIQSSESNFFDPVVF